MTAPYSPVYPLTVRLAHKGLCPPLATLWELDSDAACAAFADFYKTCEKIPLDDIHMREEPPKTNFAAHMLWTRAQNDLTARMVPWLRPIADELKAAMNDALEKYKQRVRRVSSNVYSIKW